MSRVPDASVLWKKETRKQGVHTQQPFTGQGYDFLIYAVQVTLVVQGFELSTEPL
jgi:hypothetical protein